MHVFEIHGCIYPHAQIAIKMLRSILLVPGCTTFGNGAANQTFDRQSRDSKTSKRLKQQTITIFLGNPSTYHMNSPFYAVQKALKIDIFNVNSNEVDER